MREEQDDCADVNVSVDVTLVVSISVTPLSSSCNGTLFKGQMTPNFKLLPTHAAVPVQYINFGTASFVILQKMFATCGERAGTPKLMYSVIGKY